MTKRKDMSIHSSREGFGRSWSKSKPAKPRIRTPEQRAAELAHFADVDLRNAARREARLAAPEPDYAENAEARIEALEKAAPETQRILAGKAYLDAEDKAHPNQCDRSELLDGEWVRCDQPCWEGKVKCERHFLEFLSVLQAGAGPAIPIAVRGVAVDPTPLPPEEVRKRLARGYEPGLNDPSVDLKSHPRLGFIMKAIKPLSPSRLQLHTTNRADPPAGPANPTIERERAGAEFPVREISRTVTRFEPHEYVLNPRPLTPCDVDASHGFYEGAVCGRCIAAEQRELGQPGRVWKRCGHAKTPDNTASNGLPSGRCFTCRYGHPRGQ